MNEANMLCGLLNWSRLSNETFIVCPTMAFRQASSRLYFLNYIRYVTRTSINKGLGNGDDESRFSSGIIFSAFNFVMYEKGYIKYLLMLSILPAQNINQSVINKFIKEIQNN